MASFTTPTPDQGGKSDGVVEAGNIDLHKRPVVKNGDGSISTVRSFSISTDDGKHILLPSVIDDVPGGRVAPFDEAIQHFRRTGQHLGIFDNAESANKYAESLHQSQAKMYGGKK